MLTVHSSFHKLFTRTNSGFQFKRSLNRNRRAMSKNLNLNKMKNYTFISILLIALFSLTFVSCDKNDEDFVPEDKQSSISIKVMKSKLKYGDDDDDIPDWPIILEGTTVRSSSVTLESVPGFEVMDETTSNTAGIFYLEVEEPGNYLVSVNGQDGFTEELEISLE